MERFADAMERGRRAGESGVRQVGVQEVDIVSIVSSITKYAVTVLEPSEIRYHLEKAVQLRPDDPRAKENLAKARALQIR